MDPLWVLFFVLLCLDFGAPLIIPDHSLDPQDPPMPFMTQSRTPIAIIRACFSMLILCTWVAIHPNVPPRGQGCLRSLWRRIKLMLWTLVIPELVLLWAYRQWAAARHISILFKDEGWTMTHAYFLIMGGFTLVRNGTETVLDYESIMRMGDERLKFAFPPISAAEINDKAKSDPLAKAFAVLQSTRFIVHCIVRQKEGLAITELELVTLASASLTGIMYFFWWHKPLDVQEPIRVYPVGVYPPTKVIRPVSIITIEYGGGILIAPEQRQALSQTPSRPLKQIGLSMSEVFRHFRHFSSLWHSFGSLLSSVSLPSIGTLSLEQREELRDLAANDNCMFFYVSIYVFILAPIMVLSRSLFAIATTTTIKEDASNVPTYYAPAPTAKSDSKTLLFLLAIVATFFGGLHFIAWGHQFPSIFEQWLWRIGAGAITFIPLVTLMIAIATSIDPTTLVSTPIPQSLKKITARKFGLTVLACGALVVFILARFVLLIEAVVLLRKQPDTAFDTINWNILRHV